MIDIGVNLTNARFDKDRTLVIERGKTSAIEAMLVTGTSLLQSKNAVALCQQYPHYLYATAGVHPHDADNVSETYLADLRQLSSSEHVKAIGECGLDFNRNFSKPEQQIKVFAEQIQLASETNLPLFLHQRDAFSPWFELLTPFIDKVPAMVSHCFTGSLAEVKQCLDAGMYIGITGWLCDDKRGQALQALAKYIPLERLMIETDAPYLTPKNIRPKPKSSRNEPSYLPYVVAKLSELTGYSSAQIIKQSTANARRVFTLGHSHD